MSTPVTSTATNSRSVRECRPGGGFPQRRAGLGRAAPSRRPARDRAIDLGGPHHRRRGARRQRGPPGHPSPTRSGRGRTTAGSSWAAPARRPRSWRRDRARPGAVPVRHRLALLRPARPCATSSEARTAFAAGTTSAPGCAATTLLPASAARRGSARCPDRPRPGPVRGPAPGRRGRGADGDRSWRSSCYAEPGAGVVPPKPRWRSWTGRDHPGTDVCGRPSASGTPLPGGCCTRWDSPRPTGSNHEMAPT